jgi:hypothetical protein
MRMLEKFCLVIAWITFLLLGPSLASTPTWAGPVVAVCLLIVLVVWSKSVITQELARYVQSDKVD